LNGPAARQRKTSDRLPGYFIESRDRQSVVRKGENMRPVWWTRILGPVALVLVVLAGVYTPAEANDFKISGTAGATIPMGDVKDLIVGPGVVFGGLVHVGLTSQFYLGGGGHIAIMGGQSDAGTAETDAGLYLSFEGGGLFYLLKPEAQVRPYIAGYVGWGILSWHWDDSVTLEDDLGNIKSIDSDSNGFIYFAPEAGIDIKIADDFSFLLGGRFMLTGWTDKTNEGLLWKWNDKDIGGNFVEIFAGMSFTL
jgi:hypothetical protein